MIPDELRRLIRRRVMDAGPHSSPEHSKYCVWREALVMLIEEHCTDRRVAKELIETIWAAHTVSAAVDLAERYPDTIPQIATVFLLTLGDTQ